MSYVKIQSGTGDFSSVSPEKKQISVITGSTISGEVIMSTLNGMNATSTAPLIGTTSWGDHSTSYWTVNGAVLWGEGVYNASVSVVAPTTPGKYYLIFSFNPEMDGAYVASSTNSMRTGPVWNDGNDLAGLNSSYIVGMQMSGRVSLLYLMQYGYTPWTCPADAITVIVSENMNGTVSGHVTDSDGRPIAGATVTLDSGPSGVTDANGRFSFNMTQGNYSMTISKDGFENRQMPISITPGLVSEIGNISAQSKMAPADPDIDLGEVIIVVLVACLVAMVCIIIILGWRNSRM